VSSACSDFKGEKLGHTLVERHQVGVRRCQSSAVRKRLGTAKCFDLRNVFDVSDHSSQSPQSLEYKEGVELRDLCTFGIGGPARLFVEVTSLAELRRALRYCREANIKYFVVGKGSNCLFDDRGFDGLIILNRIAFLEDLGQGRFRVGSGFNFNYLGTLTSRQGWSGLEFAAGIPGTVGGAVYMNAGANGQDTGSVLEEVEWVDLDCKLHKSRKLMKSDFSYRKSPFQEMKNSGVLYSATFKLVASPDARERQERFLLNRKCSQPVNAKSAGCIFRNPGPGSSSAGALIDQNDLKGEKVGGAQVSYKHANFLVNTGTASASDVRGLIQVVKDRVKEESGHDLHEEILFIPWEGSGEGSDQANTSDSTLFPYKGTTEEEECGAYNENHTKNGKIR